MYVRVYIRISTMHECFVRCRSVHACVYKNVILFVCWNVCVCACVCVCVCVCVSVCARARMLTRVCVYPSALAHAHVDLLVLYNERESQH